MQVEGVYRRSDDVVAGDVKYHYLECYLQFSWSYITW